MVRVVILSTYFTAESVDDCSTSGFVCVTVFTAESVDGSSTSSFVWVTVCLQSCLTGVREQTNSGLNSKMNKSYTYRHFSKAKDVLESEPETW